MLALDAGGGSGHAAVVDVGSRAVTRAHRPWRHPTAPATGGLGVDADLPAIWDALVSAAREALATSRATASEVAGIATTSMRHTTVVLDGTGAVLFAAPTRDGRAIMETFEAMEPPPIALYDTSGHWPNPVATALRWRWLVRNRPEVTRGASTVLSLSDWIAWRLCGERMTEPSLASETLLLDVGARRWSQAALDRFEVPRAVLPEIAEAGSRLGALRADAAEALGLSAGIAVAVGGGDTQCGVLGTGTFEPGDAAAIGGTTIPVQMVTDRPQLDPERRAWTCCYVRSDRWVVESNAGSVGEALAWFARVMAPDAAAPVARLLAEASRSVPGACGGFSTLGGTIMDARALELPVGHLTFSHIATAEDPAAREHVARALVEGMVYAVRGNLERLEEVTGHRPARLGFGGGLARSRTFAEILAGVLDRPVTLGGGFDATAVGAAICAGVGAGVFRDVDEGARALAPAIDVVEPVHAPVYATGYAAWRRLRSAQDAADAVARDAILPAMLARLDASSAPTAATSRRLRILATADLDAAALADLHALGEVTYASFRDTMRLLGGDTLTRALAGVDVLITEVDLVDAAVLRGAPDLRVVAACRGDAVNVSLEACTAFGVPVLHAPGRNADAVADLTLAFLLMLARRLPDAGAFLRQPGMRAGDMARMGQAFTQLRGHELWRKTVGLVGLGAVGRQVARRLAGFGARIVVADPFVVSEQAALLDAEVMSLHDLLAVSDFVSLHAPVTEATRGLIGAAELARMRAGAFLVNTARASLVDEGALMEALRSGHLGGAALDVFSVEPPGADHPLLQLAGVIATPHVGGNTVQIGAHQGRIVADELRRLLAGQRPHHILNPATLEGFSWEGRRPDPDEAALARLASSPGPAVSDLQHERTIAPSAVIDPAAITAPPDVIDKVRRVLEDFLRRASDDRALRGFAAGKDATLHFVLPEVGCDFYVRMRGGRFEGALGQPADGADVELGMPAEVLDGMFTGTLDAMQAAANGRISFAGDAMKAMTLQEIQGDLARCYQAARAEVGDPRDAKGD